jgi:predicted GIY-YIG superfamily endonuclease
MTYQKPQPRPYFYTENGKTKPYRYCTLCSDGPFKDADHQIEHMGGQHSPIYYCTKCLNVHSLSKPVVVEPEFIDTTIAKSIAAEKKVFVKKTKFDTIFALGNDGKDVTVYLAEGKDGAYFCSYTENVATEIKDINSGVIKRQGIKNASIPIKAVYQQPVSRAKADELMKKIRTLTRDDKKKLAECKG